MVNAESLKCAKSKFLTNMDHELRTLLNSIIGFSDLMLEGLSGELNEKQIRHTGNILNIGKHLLAKSMIFSICR
ncbi:histidine kinase dimerization/phospho-acceptor domain-containing protein [Methanolobus sp. ZRKC5]|uniref:histidine kinase dimerization/phospho-acceptor domain-containing protein n=1 Tax=unclassified Methanolobus TaxID=2629569 RepID=UPI00313DBFCE